MRLIDLPPLPAAGTCPFRQTSPLSRPPQLAIRSSVFHSLHSGCVHVAGLPSDFSLHNTVCYGAKGAQPAPTYPGPICFFEK